MDFKRRKCFKNNLTDESNFDKLENNNQLENLKAGKM